MTKKGPGLFGEARSGCPGLWWDDNILKFIRFHFNRFCGSTQIEWDEIALYRDEKRFFVRV